MAETILQVKNIIHLTLRDNQRVPNRYRINIEERKKFFILRNLMTRDLSCHDSTKYRCHNCISYLIKVISP